MKKILLPLVAILFLAAWQLQISKSATATPQGPAALASSNQGEKVTICHREGNGSSHAITVSIHAVPAHLAHGDVIGNCGGGGGEE